MDCGGMMWMRLPGQSWPGAAAAFLLMWAPMMAAMMLPVLAPMLWRYRQALEPGMRRNRLTLLAAAGYLLAWTACGAAVFPLGAALTAAAMRWPALARAVPLAAGLMVLAAGALQLGAWKSRRLACCREMPACARGAHAGGAWRHGLRLGWRCVWCCLEPTTMLLALGVMNPGVMAAVTVAIGAERLAPAGERVARGFGAAAVAAGLVLVLRAL
jgi:predicted metal-binding membrane protein